MAKSKKPPRDWTVDSAGRWRDSSGRFASRKAVLTRVAAGTPEDTGMMLQQAGTHVRGAKGDYAVQVYFEGVGWRSASYATGLGPALMQAGDFLENQVGQQVGYYGKKPVVTDVAIARVKSGKAASLKRKKGAKYRQSPAYKERAKATAKEIRLKEKLAAAKATIRELMKERKAKRKSKAKPKKGRKK